MANPLLRAGGMTVTVPTPNQGSGTLGADLAGGADIASPSGQVLTTFGAAPAPGASATSGAWTLTNISPAGQAAPYTFSLQAAGGAAPGAGYTLNINLPGQAQNGPFDVGPGAPGGGQGPSGYLAVPVPSLTATPVLIGNVPAIQLAGF